MEKLLTICIPTHCRSQLLKENLDNLVAQWDDRLEVFISDNASTDDTEDVARSYLQMGKAISYFRQKENVGLDRNFATCFEKATGKYVLLLGDDDQFISGVIPSLLDVLEKQDDVTLFVLNPSHSFPADRCGHYDETTLKEGLETINVYLTFMSILIFNRSVISQARNTNDFSKYFGSLFFHVNVLFDCLAIRPSLFIDDHDFLNPTDNSTPTSYNFYDIFDLSWHRILRQKAIPLIGWLGARRIFSLTLRHYFPYWIVMTKVFPNSKQHFRFCHFWDMCSYFWFWAKVLPFILLSRRSANRIYQKRFQAQHETGRHQ
jgi:glycosyltransferase involved in cell wall biosynthesis